eukprot:1489051-Rhodomonas_salina.5
MRRQSETAEGYPSKLEWGVMPSIENCTPAKNCTPMIVKIATPDQTEQHHGSVSEHGHNQTCSASTVTSTHHATAFGQLTQGEKEKTAEGHGSSLGKRRKDAVKVAQRRHQLGQLLDLEP